MNLLYLALCEADKKGHRLFEIDKLISISS